MKDISIGNYTVGPNSPPFIIAELSGNHGQNLDTAIAMIRAAAEAGAHAIKLQTYTADTMTLDVENEDFLITEESSLWKGEKLHSLYAKAATPYEWHEKLFSVARELGLEAFSSPFDGDAVDFLESLNVPCYKIASFEITDLPLISKAASKGKPLIISTGMATVDEIYEAISVAEASGCSEIILLKCTSTYPASAANSNLNTIPDMRDKFDRQIGLSDHSLGIGVAIASVAIGAVVIEKHFVLDRTAGGVDADFSLEPDELKCLVVESDRAWHGLGIITYGATKDEQDSKQYRRSIYAKQDIAQGEILTTNNVQIIRPAFGLAPKHWDEVIGQTATSLIKRGTALNWQMITGS